MTDRFIMGLALVLVLCVAIIATHQTHSTSHTLSNVQYDTLCAYDPAIGRIMCRMIRK